jgi:hypothetical protein
MVESSKHHEHHHSHHITIFGASYGLADVTEHLIKLVHGQNSVTIKAVNDVFGDPWPGTKKTLTIVYRIGDGPIKTAVTEEGQSVQIGEPHEHHGGAYTELVPSTLKVEVSSTVDGGGTGKEHPINLLIPGNDPGNKWYTGNGGEQWIRVILPEPKAIKLYGLKSANDVEDRDPSSWEALGKTVGGEWEVFHQVSGVKFDHRYQFKYFAVSPKSEYTQVQFNIKKNLSVEKGGNWGSGTQLAEVSLFV